MLRLYTLAADHAARLGRWQVAYTMLCLALRQANVEGPQYRSKVLFAMNKVRPLANAEGRIAWLQLQARQQAQGYHGNYGGPRHGR